MPSVVTGSGAQQVNGVGWAANGQGFETHFIGGNPIALILPNGTTLVMYRGGGNNHTQCRKLGVVVRGNTTYPVPTHLPTNWTVSCTFGRSNVTRFDVTYPMYWLRTESGTRAAQVPSDGNGYPGCTVVGLARADHWSGPYSIVGGPAIPFQQEDFYIFKNKR